MVEWMRTLTRCTGDNSRILPLRGAEGKSRGGKALSKHAGKGVEARPEK